MKVVLKKNHEKRKTVIYTPPRRNCCHWNHTVPCVQRLMLSEGAKRTKFYHITVILQYCWEKTTARSGDIYRDDLGILSLVMFRHHKHFGTKFSYSNFVFICFVPFRFCFVSLYRDPQWLVDCHCGVFKEWKMTTRVILSSNPPSAVDQHYKSYFTKFLFLF